MAFVLTIVPLWVKVGKAAVVDYGCFFISSSQRLPTSLFLDIPNGVSLHLNIDTGLVFRY